MVFAGLSLDQAPPYSATVKFFLTGFLYALLGGVYLLFSGGGLYDPIFLHLMTLGFMGFTMVGAVFQFLPVVGGITFKNIKPLSNVVYFFLHLGLLSFVFGFSFYNSTLFILAASALFGAVAVFSSSIIFKTLQNRTKNISIASIALATFFLMLATVVGVLMLYAHVSGDFSALALYKNWHMHLALYGWTVLLVMGVSFQVIPMFWVAKDFSKRVKTAFVAALSLSLLLYLLSSFYGAEQFAKLLLLSVVIIYSLSMIHTLKNRKRKLTDYSVKYWYMAMASLCISSVLLLFKQPQLAYAVFGYGFIYSVISAMIYKILPFLTWFFLSAKARFDIPTMKEMVGTAHMRYCFLLHCTAYLLLLFAIITQQKLPFAIIFTLLSLYHLYNLFGVVRVYRKYS
ncbi:MAG: hypothetical protein ACQESH_07175 [Campylobacterota bacterium]